MRRKRSLRASYAEKWRKTAFRQEKRHREALKRRKPLKKISRSQRDRMADYFQIRNLFLRENPACGICLCLSLTPAPATEVHHLRGRNGSLLFDPRGFVPSCRQHREWPHENPKLAREYGVLAEARDWGVPFERKMQPLKNCG